MHATTGQTGNRSDAGSLAALLLPAQRAESQPATDTGRPGGFRSRMRGLTATDEVEFTASCPVCGTDCTWTARREDTRLTLGVGCSC